MDPPHRYRFQVFALDTVLQVPPGADRDQGLAAMRGRVLAKGERVGQFLQQVKPPKQGHFLPTGNPLRRVFQSPGRLARLHANNLFQPLACLQANRPGCWLSHGLNAGPVNSKLKV
jgi:hypothetical protein